MFRLFCLGLWEFPIEKIAHFAGVSIGRFRHEDFILHVGEDTAESFGEPLLNEKARIVAILRQQIAELISAAGDFGHEAHSVGFGSVDARGGFGAGLGQNLIFIAVSLVQGPAPFLFGIHHAVIDELHEHYRDISVTLTGSTPQTMRQRVIEQFRDRASTRLMIANIDVGGIGLNLQFASNVAIIEIPWTPGQCTQAEGRVDRIGQKSTTNIFYMVAKDTIEISLCDLVQRKQEVLTAVLDGNGHGEELDILDRLMQTIMEQR